MPSWQVIMTARGTESSVTTEAIPIKRGIFQGDSLSPLLFCLAINPLSFILNKYAMKGYKLKNSFSINHLLYMDDLKLYSNNKHSLQILLDSVEIFTGDIGMKFGLDKCNVVHINSGHRTRVTGEGHILLDGKVIKQLKEGDSYKYLGIHETGKIEHSNIKDKVIKEYFKRIKKLLNTHLNSRYLFKGINSYAIPVLLYTFGIINYKKSDLNKIDVKTRKLLTIKKAHQHKAEVNRLYLPITQGGRGLINVEYMYKAQIIKFKQYLKMENDNLIKAIVNHDIRKDKYSIIKESQEFENEINLKQENSLKDGNIKEAIFEKYNKTWRNKHLHGQFPKKILDTAHIDTELSFKWIKKHNVSPNVESSAFAMQDQAVTTRQYRRDIMKEPIDGKCRLCICKDETIQHIISGCKNLAGSYYVKRHNNLVQYVYWCLAKKHSIKVSNFWWKETLKQPQVEENETVKILWEFPIQTDITIVHNRPDLIYINKANNITYLIDITVPSDYNIGPKEIEKLSKYHLLKLEISRLWNTQTVIIPIVIGATGVVAKNLKKYTDQLDANIDITILQKQAVIHSSIIIGRVLGDCVFVNGQQIQGTQNYTISSDLTLDSHNN